MTTTVQNPSTTTPQRTSSPVPDQTPGRRWLAVLRIATGFIFLWAFFDKTFGLGYSTAAAKAWIRGGSPTSGFLGHVTAGPLRSMFTALADSTIVDVLFMLGMLAIGVALILGIGLRLSAVTGTLILMLMWAAEWPPARVAFDGQPTGSVNPIVDYHLIYAVVLIVLALLAAGPTWGLGRSWESTSIVKRLPWLK
jgi:thiosulfate dehydrogenase [quinone] large subunit